MTATGDRQIIAIHMKGEMVDLQNSLLRVADHSVQMLTPGKVAMARREDVIQLTMKRPPVAHAMWIDTLVRPPFESGSLMLAGETPAPAWPIFCVSSPCVLGWRAWASTPTTSCR